MRWSPTTGNSTVWQLMQDEARLQRLSADGRQRLRHVRGVVHTAFAARDRQHPRRWLEGVWLKLGGPRCLEAPAALDDVAAFFAPARPAGRCRQTEPGNPCRSGRRIVRAGRPAGRCGADDDHPQSKGLEFDTVILPGLHRETGGGESNLLLWDEVAGADGAEHLLVAPMRRKGSDKAEPTAYDYLRRLEPNGRRTRASACSTSPRRGRYVAST
jgi:hypothetical protein